MTALVSKTSLSGTPGPTRATANAGFGSLWDFINERLGAGGANDAERAASLAALGIAVPRGYIDGLVMSTAGSSTTMTVGAGMASDSSAAWLMRLASSLGKTTSAWSAGTGNGGRLSAASLANNTWYYWYLLRNSTSGAVDVGFDVSSSTPTLPSGFTHARYIGAGLTNGSGQWTKFFQVGDEFLFDQPVSQDINTTTLSTTQTSFTVSVPRGRAMLWNALINFGGSGNSSLLLGSPLQVLPAATFANGDLFQNVAGTASSLAIRLMTNTSAQIAAIANAASTNLRARTLGWVDQRGRND